MKQLIHKDKTYTLTSNNLYSFYVEEGNIPKYEPFVTWNKSPIPLDIWDKIKGICASTFADHKSECMVRIFYSEKLDSWEAQVHPQEMNGMTVDDEFDQELLNTIDKSYRQCGTVHHHCSTGAFASGTDEKDETNSIGLHITLGHINKDDWDLHYRFRTPSNLQDPDLLSFFQFPDWINEAPEAMQEDIKFNLLTLAGNPNDAPQEWKDNCTKKVYVHTNKGYGNTTQYTTGYAGSYGYSEQAIRSNIQSQLSLEQQEAEDLINKEAEEAEDEQIQKMEDCLDLISQMDPYLGEIRVLNLIRKFNKNPQTIMTSSEEELDHWKIVEGCCTQTNVDPEDLVLFTGG
jgi:hypothetical protein